MGIFLLILLVVICAGVAFWYLSTRPEEKPCEECVIPSRDYHEIVDELKFHFNTHYGDPKDSIGKRYRRQDAIGTPFCITVDHETPNDHKVTLRYRDTMEQERVAISDLRSIIEERVSITSVLKKLGNEIKNF